MRPSLLLDRSRRTGGLRTLGVLAAVLMGAGALGIAAAQNGSSPPANATPPGEPTTPSEQVAAAERIVSHAQALRIAINQRLEAATRRNDIVMVDCLTPLLTQLEASLAGAEARVRALRLLARGGDQAAVEHEYTMVRVLEPRFQLVEADMNQCLGDQDITTGDDQVTVDVTITIPDEDPAAPLQEPPVVPVAAYVPPPLSPAY